MFNFFNKTKSDCALQEIYPLSLDSNNFINADLLTCYSKILIDVLERTSGIPDKVQPLLWDNCVQSESNLGLVSLLSEAMVRKADLFLVYLPSVNLLRLATHEEQAQIKDDYIKKGSSNVGVYISFKHFKLTDMLLVYSALEYCILSSLHKTVNISKAVQIKINDLRSSVSLADASVAVEQAQSLASALREGRDIFLDVADQVTNATPEVGPTEKAIEFLDAKRAYLLNLPISYVSGLQTPGIGSTGEADARAVERGLKRFYFSIIKPAIEKIFDVKTQFKTQDFRQMTSALEALKTFELVGDDDDLLPRELQQDVLARLFDFDVNYLRKAIDKAKKERQALQSNVETTLSDDDYGDD